MSGLVFHTLKGIKGWSSLDISIIDISRINKIFYEKRLFCIFDRDYPYTLTIQYNQPVKTYQIMPVYGGRNGYSTIIMPTVELTQLITKRYKTEDDVINEIAEIEKNIKKLELFRAKIANEINTIELK
jgi:hypothetical protein